MTDKIAEFLPELRRYPRLYVANSSFLAVSSFLNGFHWGSDDKSLAGFHDWLMLRGRGRSELAWPWLVLCELYPHSELPDIRNFTEEQDSEAIRVLFELLEDYYGKSN